MKITVMGPGGVGGYFGARLAAAGNDVTFVARGAHLDAMRKSGLRLDSEIGALHLQPVKAVASASEVPEADAVIFAVKLRDTEAAAEQLTGLTAKGATVFTFQNGVESADRIGKIVGPRNVVAGAARINAQIAGPGVIRQAGKFASLEFGEADNKPSARTSVFLEACKQAGITAVLSDNISRTIWMKFVMLTAMSATTALTRGPIGPIRANPQSRKLLESAIREAAAVGEAMEGGVTAADADAAIKQLDALPPMMMASMCHDLLAGKPLEIDGLSGALVRLGARHNVPVPTHTFVTQALAPFANGREAGA